jgi:DNA-binding NtrC family response regulator
MEVLRDITAVKPDLPIVMITGYASVETAIKAMKMGAVDYIVKPFRMEEVELVVGKALERSHLRRENVYLRRQLETTYGVHNIIGQSPVMRRLYALIEQVASSRSTVLITGASGTGKELVARAIYHHGQRAEQPFLAINCAAIPENLLESELFGHERGAFTGAGERRLGKFELASGGTVFLDEIGELPLAVQGKLLRAIEEKSVDRIGGRGPVPVDVRVVAATNKDLRGAVDKGEFRGDLFFRLAVFPIEIPPLRERGDDVVLLGRHFAAQLGKELRGREATLSDASVAAFRAHRWPGNIRELENSIERACILADDISLEPRDLGFSGVEGRDPGSFGFDTSGTLGEAAERAVKLVERRKIADALIEYDGNKTRAAEALGVSYKTLLTKIKDYSL